MVCPICEKRKAKRFCPAKAENICTLCCGTEREVTIDCPPDCPYLIESRRHEYERREVDWASVPFADSHIGSSFIAGHEHLILALGYAICQYARDNAAVTDSDAIAGLKALAETYQTLSNGIYYENPPDYLLQRGIYDSLKAAIEDFRKVGSRDPGFELPRDSEVRDALIFLTRVGATHSNGRPRGRAFLDLLRRQYKSDEFQKPSSGLLVVP